jgi:hypothetical protein
VSRVYCGPLGQTSFHVLWALPLFPSVEFLCHILLFISVMEPKCKSKSDNEAKKSCEVVILDHKIRILCKLRCCMCAVAVGLTLRWCFVLMSNFPVYILLECVTFPTIIYYFTYFVHK